MTTNQQGSGASADADRAVVNGAQEVSAVPASVPSAGEHIIQYLEGVVGVVSAERFEHHSLWIEHAEAAAQWGSARTSRYSWVETGHGYGVTVGYLADMPVHISLMTATVDGHKLLFIYPTSLVVDHRLIDAWLLNNLPASAYRASGRINHADAMNFHNVFPAQAIEAQRAETQGGSVHESAVPNGNAP